MANKKYIIWDGITPVKTPSGEIFTAEQWLDRYPAYLGATDQMILSSGFYNGALIDNLEMMKVRLEQQGAAFDESLTGEALLDAMAAWEDEKAAADAAVAEAYVSTEERIAASLEYQNLMNY